MSFCRRKCKWCGRCLYYCCAVYRCEFQQLRGPRGFPGCPGQKGERGQQGVQGEAGVQGARGDDGIVLTLLDTYNSYEELVANHPTGNIGDMYLVNGDTFVWSENEQDWINAGMIKGARGDIGPTGPPGPKGDDGIVLTLLDTFATYEELVANHPSGSVGDMYLVNGDTYVWSENEQDWINAGMIKGAKGDDGAKGETGPAGEAGTFDISIPLLYTTDSTGLTTPLFLGDSLPLSTFTTLHKKYEGESGEGESLIKWDIQTTTIDLDDETSLISIFGNITLADFTSRENTINVITTTDDPRFERLTTRIDKHAENTGNGEMNMLLYYYDQTGMNLTDQLTLAGGADLIFNFQDVLILSTCKL